MGEYPSGTLRFKKIDGSFWNGETFRFADYSRYIDGIETERKRLAQELHDGVCNDLLVAEMQITNTASTAQATQQLNAVRQNIRHISHQLMPPNTAFATLDQTLSALACKLHEMGHIAITFSATPAHHNWAALPAAQAHQLYRIAQELITNLIKHTPQLTHISITLTHSPAAPPHHAHHRPHRGSCTNRPLTNLLINHRPVFRWCRPVPHTGHPRHWSAFHQRASQGHQRHHRPHHRPPGPAHHHHQLLIYIYVGGISKQVDKLTG